MSMKIIKKLILHFYLKSQLIESLVTKGSSSEMDGGYWLISQGCSWEAVGSKNMAVGPACENPGGAAVLGLV